jgi:HK97 family phage portal protein
MRNYARDAALWLTRKAAGGLLNIDWYFRNGYRRIGTALSIGDTYTGRSVTEFSALNCATVFACARIISEDAASLPLITYERTDNGKQSMVGSRLYEILHDQPNQDSTAMEFREALTMHAVTWGNGYALQVRRRTGDELIALYLLLPDRMRVDRTRETKELVYLYREGNEPEKTYTSKDIFHLRGPGYDGLTGYSIVSLAAQSIAMTQAAEEYGARYFARGGRPMGVLMHPAELGLEAEEKLRKRFEETHGGLSNAHKLLILEEGMKFEAVSMSQKDSQFLETRQFQIPEICRWFRMPPHKVQDLSRATFSNIVEQQLEYYTDCLRPWLVRWEQAISRCLISREQRRTIFAEHKIEGILRGSPEAQMKAFAIGIQNGIYSINDVLDLLNRNHIEGGDEHFIQLNMQTIEALAAGEGQGDTPGQQKVVSIRRLADFMKGTK